MKTEIMNEDRSMEGVNICLVVFAVGVIVVTTTYVVTVKAR